jgi:hypothetical protein
VNSRNLQTEEGQSKGLMAENTKKPDSSKKYHEDGSYRFRMEFTLVETKSNQRDEKKPNHQSEEEKVS